MEKHDDKTTKPPTAPPNHPHDKLFKTVFKRPNYARVVLEARLPEKLLNHLDLDTLRPSDASRVNPNLDEDFTDVQLTCNSKQGTPVEIALLLEHKSYRPTYPPYQLMHYQDGAWGWQVQAEGIKPTPIVPVLFYHGAENWEPKPWKDYLEGWDEVFADFTPPGGCVFIPLEAMTDEEIKNFRYGFLVAALLLMKHRLERDYLLENLPYIFNFVEEDPAESNIDNRINNLRSALRYLQGLKAIHWKEARAKLHSLKYSYQVMDVLEEVKLEGFYEGIEQGREEGFEKDIEKGREEGIEKGIEEGLEKEKFFAARNMLRKKFDAETITGVLEVQEGYVADVQKQLEKESLVTALLETEKMKDAEIAKALEVSPYLVEAVKKGLKPPPPKTEHPNP